MLILRLLKENILFLITLFLLAFIPLYPKLPIVNIQHTWVYIRFEDFLVIAAIFIWLILFFLKKVSLKTPLTLPILLFWIIGGIATLHGVLVLFPTLSNVFSNVAFLSMLRRIEYMSLFFIAYAGMKEKRFLPYAVVTLAGVLFLVVLYGFGQKFFGFPAFLTGNEEFAKGTPLTISALGRVPSTFAGHYDLAAYLVLVIPLLVSLSFGLKNTIFKACLIVTASLGFILLILTVSRVSFFALLFSLVLLLIVQKKKFILASFLVLTIAFLLFSPSLLKRFGNTVSEVNVLVNARNGVAIGKVLEVPAAYFKNKLIIREGASAKDAEASSSAILPFSQVPATAILVVEPNSPNGENLPQGTSYINLSLSPITKKVGEYFYEKSSEKKAAELAQAKVFFGDYVVKKAKAYDLSFTTRFQGEWPRTLLAFERSIFLGSGYGSVSLAVDNDYLRLLGEVGLLGFVSFLAIFLLAGIYAQKVLSKVDSPIIRNFVLGFFVGTIGLALNAVFIDVFEASKIAFTFWLLLGITLGGLSLYSTEEINLFKEFKRIVVSSSAIILYLFVASFTLFSSVLGFYFVGDDFTWFRWVASCSNCNPLTTFIGYFARANGFFYRPGTKTYFDFMYSVFWLNQTIYHLVSILLHFVVAMLIFLITKKVFKSFSLSVACAFTFLILSGYSEAVFWVSSTGFLFNAVFALLSLLFFIYWKEKQRGIYFGICIASLILSLLFHEIGVIIPILIILYDCVFGKEFSFSSLSKKTEYFIVLLPLLPYFLLRFIAQSHWFSGDYSYNVFKLPFNMVGNAIGYLALTLFGPSSLPFYEKLRVFSKEHALFALIGGLILVFLLAKGYRICCKKLGSGEKKIAIFGLLFFIISLLPFLGLGNITSRYSYLSSFGVVLLFVFLLKKTYNYLLDSGKYVAIAIVTLIVIVFVSFHLFQLQKIQIDWRDAGEKTKNFLVSLDYVYAHYPRENTEKLFFVNSPLRNGEAWVFPVGLKDAVWLVFRDDRVKVYQAPSVDSAFRALGGNLGMVFKFADSGGLIEMKKLQSGAIIPIPISE